jgi:hypothetical protein
MSLGSSLVTGKLQRDNRDKNVRTDVVKGEDVVKTIEHVQNKATVLQAVCYLNAGLSVLMIYSLFSAEYPCTKEHNIFYHNLLTKSLVLIF